MLLLALLNHLSKYAASWVCFQVCCSGHGKNGALCVLRQSIRPETITEVYVILFFSFIKIGEEI